MEISTNFHNKKYKVNLNKGLDISIPIIPGADGPNCFYAPICEASPVRTHHFVGSVKEGGPVNFYNLKINPHGNGTHTECVGHISKEDYFINQTLSEFHFMSKLITVTPDQNEYGNRMITKSILAALLKPEECTCVIIRTLPNNNSKLSYRYSGTNPPFFDTAAISYLNDCGIHHLITDLPSVDKEEDGGKLSAHKRYWNYPEQTFIFKTITELVYAPDSIVDGYYFTNIQTLNINLDASPSRIVLFPLELMD